MITTSLERMRSEGTLKQRKSRNPLNYEATPRNYELGDEMLILSLFVDYWMSTESIAIE